MRRRTKKYNPGSGTAFALCLLLLFCTVSCGASGKELCSIRSGNLTYTAYGVDAAISSVVVKGADGSVLSTLKIKGGKTSGEPYSAEDGLNYGMTVADLDGDGDDDIAVCLSRTPGAERVAFFLGDGSGSFRRNELLSSFVSPSFGEGGIVSFTEVIRIEDILQTPDAPPMYQLKRITRSFASDGLGGIFCIGAEELSYYSEGDIYCAVTYVPAAEGEEADDPEYRLAIGTEKWIPAEHLAEYGYEPLG